MAIQTRLGRSSRFHRWALILGKPLVDSLAARFGMLAPKAWMLLWNRTSARVHSVARVISAHSRGSSLLCTSVRPQLSRNRGFDGRKLAPNLAGIVWTSSDFKDPCKAFVSTAEVGCSFSVPLVPYLSREPATHPQISFGRLVPDRTLLVKHSTFDRENFCVATGRRINTPPSPG